jgi:hypothetical protein
MGLLAAQYSQSKPARAPSILSVHLHTSSRRTSLPSRTTLRYSLCTLPYSAQSSGASLVAIGVPWAFILPPFFPSILPRTYLGLHCAFSTAIMLTFEPTARLPNPSEDAQTGSQPRDLRVLFVGGASCSSIIVSSHSLTLPPQHIFIRDLPPAANSLDSRCSFLWFPIPDCVR